MRVVQRALAVIGILVLVIVVVVAGAGFYLVRRPWPQIKGNLAVAGLTSPVQVIRDKWGVPQIYAQSEHDLLFAQGYVHAQVASGRWSSIGGSAAERSVPSWGMPRSTSTALCARWV